MGQRFGELSERHVQFIEKQRIFFVGTATADSRVNVSPKGMDSLRVLGKSRVAWLNVTGSGNETAAHLRERDRMTLMFCAFEGAPLILRIFGRASALMFAEAGADVAGLDRADVDAARVAAAAAGPDRRRSCRRHCRGSAASHPKKAASKPATGRRADDPSGGA